VILVPDGKEKTTDKRKSIELVIEKEYRQRNLENNRNILTTKGNNGK
jgi:hypothetical protein